MAIPHTKKSSVFVAIQQAALDFDSDGSEEERIAKEKKRAQKQKKNKSAKKNRCEQEATWCRIAAHVDNVATTTHCCKV